MKKNTSLKVIEYKNLKLKEIIFLLTHTSFNLKQCFLLFDQQMIIFNNIHTSSTQVMHFVFKTLQRKKLEKVGVFTYQAQNVSVMIGIYNKKILASHIKETSLLDDQELATFVDTFSQKTGHKNKEIPVHEIPLTVRSPMSLKLTQAEVFFAAIITTITFFTLFFLHFQ